MYAKNQHEVTVGFIAYQQKVLLLNQHILVFWKNVLVGVVGLIVYLWNVQVVREAY